MDFEEIPESLPNGESAKSDTKSSKRQKGPDKNKDTREKVSPESSDPFGFVHTEMEKLQVKTRGSPAGRGTRSRTNTPSPVRILSKSKSGINVTPRTPLRRSSESAGSSEGSPLPSSKRTRDNRSLPTTSTEQRQDSQERKGRGRPKACRNLSRTPSRENQSPARNTRGQSPLVTKGRGRKAWAEKSASSSQEY